MIDGGFPHKERPSNPYYQYRLSSRSPSDATRKEQNDKLSIAKESLGKIEIFRGKEIRGEDKEYRCVEEQQSRREGLGPTKVC